MIDSIIQPKEPFGSGWKKLPFRMPRDMGYPYQYWGHSNGLLCISAVEVANEPGEPELGPEYHLSISMNGGRCSSAEAAFALHAFGLNDAKEDNHVPSGKVRNYWRPVADNLSGYECPCKDNEPAMVEDKGDYIWRGVTE